MKHAATCRITWQLGRMFLGLVGLLLAVSPAGAIDLSETVRLHGYGGWAAGRSDNNAYLAGVGEDHIEAHNAEAVILIEANPVEQLKLTIAPEFEVEGEEEESKLELLYAEWAFRDNLKFRIGRVRMPFGLYADLYDVGTQRPFYHLPQAIYGSTGFIDEAYDGLGLAGTAAERGGWSLAWDVYVGGANFDVEEPFEIDSPGDGEEDDGEQEAAEAHIDEMVGGRLTLATPVEGLSVAVSSFVAKPEAAGDVAASAEPGLGDFRSTAVSVEYLAGPWSLRVEGGRHDEDEFSTDAWYTELAYRLTPRWQLAGRVESAKVRDFAGDLPASARSTLEHDEVAFGINRWFSPHLVVKLSVHRVDGNLFANQGGEAQRDLEPRTDLVVFGAQFSF